MEALQVSGVSRKGNQGESKSLLYIYNFPELYLPIFFTYISIPYLCLCCTIITLVEAVMHKFAFGSSSPAVAWFTIKLPWKVNSAVVVGMKLHEKYHTNTLVFFALID